MSKALKCDRCGQCFLPGSAEYVKADTLWFATGDKYSQRYDNFDLCLCCSNEFKRWLNKNKRSCDGDEMY